jgi:beta-glucosidase
MSEQETNDGIRARAEELLSRMTPAEKAGQLTQYFYFKLPAGAQIEPTLAMDATAQPRAVEQALAHGEVGSLPFVTDPAETNRLQRLALEGNRHQIPLIFGFDVIHGLRTIFPSHSPWPRRGISTSSSKARRSPPGRRGRHPLGVCADGRYRAGRAVGRMIEGAGEDPFLGAAVAAAQVRGFQGGSVGRPDRIIAGPKHFAGYGAALGGRDYDEVNLSDYELWNTYLPPFQAAVDAGAGNVMTAYMPLNGVPATGNGWLFTEVLRDSWGFDGFVVSDANAVRNLATHGFAADLTDAGARAVTAGVDLEMAISDRPTLICLRRQKPAPSTRC